MGKKPRRTASGGGGLTFDPFQIGFPRDTALHYTPFLVVRSFESDDGGRPSPGVWVWWESPDIWVVNPDGGGQPIAGQPNQVYARVSNFGLQQATGVLVNFWWISASTTIPPVMTFIDTAWVASIPSGWSVTVKCPTDWIPVMIGDGHECLFVEASIPIFDPATPPMNPSADRHVASKNEQVIGAAPGGSFSVLLQVENVARNAQPVTIEIHPVQQKTIPPVVTERGGRLRTRILPPSTALPLTF